MLRLLELNLTLVEGLETKKKNKTNYQEQFKRSELSGILCFCNTFAILLQHFAVLKGNYNCVVLYLFACLIHSLISKILKINK